MKTQVIQDEITSELANAFDYEFNGETEFNEPIFKIPESYQIGLIVGPSGSGKSTILKKIGNESPVDWDTRKAICSHFESAEDARDRLGAVGLNSVPVWMKPAHVLSTGERFRADTARRLKSGAVIDEFTSVVDRDVAKSCSFAIQRYIRASGLQNITFATCHYDVEEWLQPDWIFDTSTGILRHRGSERRPEIEIRLLPCTAKAWALFRNHHYLSADINTASRCWIAVWGKSIVGFASAITFPSGTIKNAWRGHRTVVLPEFQGLGLGVRISDAVARILVSAGCRYFSKTSSARMGRYRNNSKLWKPTSKNEKARPDYKSGRETKESGHKMRHVNRVCYSHEFIGSSSDQ